jgi:hypothetical protein
LPRFEGGGTHTGPAFGDFLAGSLPANTGRKMRFTGTTVLKLKDGKITEEIGLDDGVSALQPRADQACRLANDNRKAGLPDCRLEGRQRRHVSATVQCGSPSQQRPGCSPALLVPV